MIYSSNLLRIKADGHKRLLGTLVDDRLHLPDAKSDKNAKNARFAVGSDAKSDKNGKNARFTLGLVDDSNRLGPVALSFMLAKRKSIITAVVK